MNFRTIPLRRRVTIAYTALGLVLSLLFSGAVLYITEDYEGVLVKEILHGQAEDYGLRLARNPDTPLPSTHRLSGYLRDRHGRDDIPPEYARLLPGLYESGQDELNGMHIGVFDTDVGRMVFVIDLRDIEALERHLAWFLAAMIVFGTGLAGWLGWLLSKGTVAPVTRLAEAVDALPTQPASTALAASVSQDELGRLASAIDHYQARLVAADANERAFFADASHELRTPMAVVRGTAEVLLDDPAATPAARQRLRRLDRGIQELTDLLDVLLGLARRRPLQPERIEARRLLQEAAPSQGDDRLGTGVTLRLLGDGYLLLPRRESLLLLRSLVRSLVPPDARGRLILEIEEPRLRLAFRDAEAGAMACQVLRDQRSDRGMGLTVTSRLAEALGWSWAQTSDGVLEVSLPQDVFVP